MSPHTLRSLCRLNEFVVPVILICIVILMTIVLATGFDFANIFPVMRKPDDFKSAIFEHSVWLGDFTPIVLFIGRTKLKKRTGLCVGVAGFSSCIVSVFVAVTMCAAFGNVPELVDSGTNLSTILQFSLGNAYGRIDMMSAVLWSVGAFIEVALFFYCASRCFAFVIGRNEHFWIGVTLAVLLYLLQVLVFGDSTLFAQTVSSIPFSAVMSAMSVIVPTVALVCAAWSRNKKKSKDATDGQTQCADGERVGSEEKQEGGARDAEPSGESQ